MFKDYKIKSKKLINHLEAKHTYHDSLDVYFFIPVASYSYGISYATFENLKSQGLDIITNKKLRLDLVKLYEEVFWRLKDQEGKMADALTSATLPFTRKHFRPREGRGYTPNDYNAILNNKEFLNLLYESYFLTQNYYNQSTEAIGATLEVIEKIDNELKE